MGWTETVIFYELFGLATAVAVYGANDKRGSWDRVFRTATAVVFWPLYIPILLAGDRVQPPPDDQPDDDNADDMALAISQVEHELDTALDSLSGWAEDVLIREKERIAELKSSWRAQAARIREMDALLERSAFAVSEAPSMATPPAERGKFVAVDTKRARQSERNRLQNLARLREMRRIAHEDLMGILAWVRELVSMIHLAKFTGAPAGRAGELVEQIAAAVEGLSEVTAWRATAASDVAGAI